MIEAELAQLSLLEIQKRQEKNEDEVVRIFRDIKQESIRSSLSFLCVVMKILSKILRNT